MRHLPFSPPAAVTGRFPCDRSTEWWPLPAADLQTSCGERAVRAQLVPWDILAARARSSKIAATASCSAPLRGVKTSHSSVLRRDLKPEFSCRGTLPPFALGAIAAAENPALPLREIFSSAANLLFVVIQPCGNRRSSNCLFAAISWDKRDVGLFCRSCRAVTQPRVSGFWHFGQYRLAQELLATCRALRPIMWCVGWQSGSPKEVATKVQPLEREVRQAVGLQL